MTVQQGEQQLHWEDIQEGQELPEMRRSPGHTQLFLVSAITGNPHRIHYDKDWAIYEGYPDLVIQGPLHGTYISQAIVRWIGPMGSLKKFGYSNRAMAFVGDELTIKGRVKKKWEEDGHAYVELEAWDENPRGEACAPATATVILPKR